MQYGPGNPAETLMANAHNALWATVETSNIEAAHAQQEQMVMGKIEYLEQYSRGMLDAVTRFSHAVGLKPATFEHNPATSSPEPIPQKSAMAGYMDRRSKRSWRQGVVGHQTETSVLIDVGELDGAQHRPGQPTQANKGYLELFVVKEVENRKQGSRIKKIPTEPIQYGFRFFIGSAGLAGAANSGELIQGGYLLQTEPDTTFNAPSKLKDDGTPSLKGNTPLAKIVNYVPNAGKLPGLETVTFDMKLAAMGYAHADAATRQQISDMFQARPSQSDEVAAQVISQHAAQPGAGHNLIINNSNEYLDAQHQKFTLAARLLQRAEHEAAQARTHY